MQHLVGDKDFAAEVRTCCGLGDIEALSDYRTGTIGSGGVRLSGGQRQRLVTSRALLVPSQSSYTDLYHVSRPSPVP